MYQVKEASKLGFSNEEIGKILNVKPGRVYYINQDSNIYSLEELKNIIINLSEVDKKIKSGLDPINGFKAFLLSI